MAIIPPNNDGSGTSALGKATVNIQKFQEKSTAAAKNDDAVNVESSGVERTAGAELDVGRANFYAQIAANAAEHIADIEEEKYTLAQEAQYADEDTRQAVQNEIDALQTQITEIKSEAVIDGVDTLAGKTFDLGDGNVVTMPDVSSMGSGTSVDLVNAPTTAVSTLKTSAETAAEYSTSVESAAGKVTDIFTERLEDIQTQKAEDGTSLDPEAASKLAEEIAQKISNGVNPEQAVLAAVAGGMNTDTVQSLLQED